MLVLCFSGCEDDQWQKWRCVFGTSGDVGLSYIRLMSKLGILGLHFPCLMGGTNWPLCPMHLEAEIDWDANNIGFDLVRSSTCFWLYLSCVKRCFPDRSNVFFGKILYWMGLKMQLMHEYLTWHKAVENICEGNVSLFLFEVICQFGGFSIVLCWNLIFPFWLHLIMI